MMCAPQQEDPRTETRANADAAAPENHSVISAERHDGAEQRQQRWVNADTDHGTGDQILIGRAPHA
jgi:hypothetical protein